MPTTANSGTSGAITFTRFESYGSLTARLARLEETVRRLDSATASIQEFRPARPPVLDKDAIVRRAEALQAHFAGEAGQGG